MTMASAGGQWPCCMRFLLLLLVASLTTTSTATPSDAVWKKIVNSNRRTAKVRTLLYDAGGEGHPFEQYSSHRLLSSSQRNEQEDSAGWKQQWGSNNGDAPQDVSFDDNRYPVSVPTAAPTTDAPTREPTPSPTTISYNPSLYKPIRIKVDSRHLLSLKEDNSRRYADLVDYITTKAAPEAAKFWSNHLSTIPVDGSIAIAEDDCPLAWSDDDDSEYHSFDDADLVLYLLMDEGPCLEDNPTIAFSNDCAMDQFDRPIAGTLLICSEHFLSVSSDSEVGRSEQQKLEEVLRHELAHVLGLSGATVPYWRDASNGGKPYMPRPLTETEVECISGETETIIMPSEDILMEGTTASGARYFEVVTPTVRNVVANQFDCEGATGARLDNNEFYNCIGSHWSPRLFGTETMVGRNMPWEQSISAVTLALLEDTGWYKANYSASTGVLRPSAHGYGAGCDFMTNECIVDGEIPAFGSNTFCNELTQESAVKCDTSHSKMAKCDLIDYEQYEDDPLYPYLENIPDPPADGYQHFTNPNLGAFIRFDADYCPTYSAPPSFSYDRDGKVSGPRYIECSISETAPDDAYSFESFGSDSSKCFNTVGDIDRPLCLSMQCIESSGDVSVAVSVRFGEEVICQEDGELIDLPGLNIKIECPRKEILCPELFCPANCSGRGICRHGITNGCECFDPKDTSPLCENSPIWPASPTPAPTEKIEDIPDDVLDDEPETLPPSESSTTLSPTSSATLGPSQSPTTISQPPTPLQNAPQEPSAANATHFNWLALLVVLLLIPL